MKIHRNYPSLSRWIPPDQPVSALAFFSSPGNMSPCLVSGSSEGHTKPRSPTVSGLMSVICGGQFRDTQQLQVIKQRLASGSAGVRPPLLSSSRVPIVSPDTLVLIFKVDAFRQNPLTSLLWTTACFPFCVGI